MSSTTSDIRILWKIIQFPLCFFFWLANFNQLKCRLRSEFLLFKMNGANENICFQSQKVLLTFLNYINTGVIQQFMQHYCTIYTSVLSKYSTLQFFYDVQTRQQPPASNDQMVSQEETSQSLRRINYHESKNVAVNKQTCQTSTFAENPFADAGAKPEVFLDLLCIK